MRKTDPIVTETKFCKCCEPKVLELIEYVRQLENAQIVAKDAINVLDAANQKLTFERKQFVIRIKELEDRLSGKSQRKLDEKMEEFRNAEQRFLNKRKLGTC
uniref:Uncharacterized protein n=1 Tax=viral metagenome TaxID=1070528 RepID=A0A6M3IKC4_9ZZZZ